MFPCYFISPIPKSLLLCFSFSVKSFGQDSRQMTVNETVKVPLLRFRVRFICVVFNSNLQCIHFIRATAAQIITSVWSTFDSQRLWQCLFTLTLEFWEDCHIMSAVLCVMSGLSHTQCPYTFSACQTYWVGIGNVVNTWSSVTNATSGWWVRGAWKRGLLTYYQ